ncbi:hypothetical protein [Bacillus alkalicellulosilyticus]|uniref:hypothetical protein n=1 Tax=Alkalihalobacterium alkalicellulosilyticum TaxID=1912214 RepID=UPI000998209B|nr:hypothetical protein [Bacillus alkalicellulosilyticus]
MLNKTLFTIMTIALVIAVVVGVFFRQTYTNVTADSNGMENFSVALWDFDISPSLIEAMREDLPESNFIIRAKSDGEKEFTFRNNTQFVEILEVYRGEGLDIGERIGITSHRWLFFFDDMTANVSFINVMQPGEEYLIFLEEEIDLVQKKDRLFVVPELIVSPIFNYEDKSHTIINVPEENRYVPYKDVKGNEFFVSSEEALEALMDVKHELLERYPR